jgi:hypothetical protein
VDSQVKRKNVVVLTTGLSGSSVFTSLIVQSGYWVGDATVVKNNTTGRYDTFENQKLVDLNEQLCSEANYQFTNFSWYSENDRGIFEGLASRINLDPYQDFINECALRDYWVWKDPKLWLTIGFWQSLLEKESVHYVILSRDPLQLWASQVSKRIIYDYRFLVNAESYSIAKLKDYLELKKLTFGHVKIESLANNTDQELVLLNEQLGSDLKMSDWNKVYRKVTRWSLLKRFVVSVLIYVKNHASRLR